MAIKADQWKLWIKTTRYIPAPVENPIREMLNVDD